MRFFSVGIVFTLTMALPVCAAFAQATLPGPAIDRVFARYASSDEPGCAVAVSHGSGFSYARGFGLASLEHRTPITAETVFDVMSVSKQFTAAAVALLEKEGKVAFNASVRSYLPELPVSTGVVTLRHLLNHTGGLRDVYTLWELQGRHARDVYTTQDILDILIAQNDFAPAPGVSFDYSNTGYLLLARVVERVTGQSLGEFTRQRFFQPLGMEQTLFYEDSGAVIPGRATGYTPTAAAYAVDQYVNFAMGGDGQLYTTIKDLLRWHEYLYGDAGDAEGIPDITSLLLTPGRLVSGETLNYGSGLFLENFRGLEEVQHHGWWGGFRAYLTRFPEASLSIAITCNRSDAQPWALGHEVAALLLQDELARAETSSAKAASQPMEQVIDSALLQSYAGRYEVEQLGIVLTIFHDSGRLTLEQGGDLLQLQTLDEASFASPAAGLLITFERDVSGSITGGTLRAGPQSALRLDFNARPEGTLRRLKDWSPSTEELAVYSGNYFSPQLQTSYEVTIEDGGLLLSHPRRGGVRVDPKDKDAFGGDFPFMGVTFERDETNGVTGLHVLAGGTEKLRFKKQSAVQRAGVAGAGMPPRLYDSGH